MDNGTEAVFALHFNKHNLPSAVSRPDQAQIRANFVIIHPPL